MDDYDAGYDVGHEDGYKSGVRETTRILTDLIVELRGKHATVTAEIDKYVYSYYGAIEPGSVDPELTAIQWCLTETIRACATKAF